MHIVARRLLQNFIELFIVQDRVQIPLNQEIIGNTYMDKIKIKTLRFEIAQYEFVEFEGEEETLDKMFDQLYMKWHKRGIILTNRGQVNKRSDFGAKGLALSDNALDYLP